MNFQRTDNIYTAQRHPHTTHDTKHIHGMAGDDRSSQYANITAGLTVPRCDELDDEIVVGKQPLGAIADAVVSAIGPAVNRTVDVAFVVCDDAWSVPYLVRMPA